MELPRDPKVIRAAEREREQRERVAKQNCQAAIFYTETQVGSGSEGAAARAATLLRTAELLQLAAKELLDEKV